MNSAKRRAIFERFRAANPHPTTELEYQTPFELLVAVILSAQATDKSVNAVTRKLFPVARTPRDIAALGVEGLSKYIRTIGLWKAKAKNVIAMASSIDDVHGGEVPRNREALESLAGVGRKTANVVLNTIFGEPTIAVDTHIFRVANRTRIAPGKTPRAVEDALLRFTPGEFAHDAHHWLILHGRYVCKALKPACQVPHQRSVRVRPRLRSSPPPPGAVRDFRRHVPRPSARDVSRRRRKFRVSRRCRRSRNRSSR
jgi:endonuclease-3